MFNYCKVFLFLSRYTHSIEESAQSLTIKIKLCSLLQIVSVTRHTYTQTWLLMVTCTHLLCVVDTYANIQFRNILVEFILVRCTVHLLFLEIF